MSPIKIEKVVSVSSEDSSHSAENLLKTDHGLKKWKSKTGGEKHISVVLKLASSVTITGLDIGNENSAFIEVLVGKSSSSNFQSLLVRSTLMTPSESKLSQNTNNVKFFKKDTLSPEALSDKWDLVKVICSQPYNNIAQFGLSFIVIHGEEDRNPDGMVGNFKIKSESDAFKLTPGSLFARRKEVVLPETGAAAAIRAATNDVLRNRGPLVASVTSADGSPPLTQPPTNDSPSTSKPVQRGTRATKPLPVKKTPQKATAKAQPFRVKPTKPFNSLFDGVVFVLSGFQNPLRSDLRSKALSMGAKYKADWDSSCTHLVCAFSNTPKFRQVRGQGKIVNKDWIEECHSKRARLPWRRFALDASDRSGKESEDEIYETVASAPAPVDNRRRVCDSSDDTDEEIEKKKRSRNKDTLPSTDVFNADTEEDETADENLKFEDNLPPLSKIFDGLVFLILDDLSPFERNKLKRYIVAHKGIVATDSTDLSEVEYVITESKEGFEEVKTEYEGVTGLRPEWIWRVHDADTLLPVTPYLV